MNDDTVRVLIIGPGPSINIALIHELISSDSYAMLNIKCLEAPISDIGVSIDNPVPPIGIFSETSREIELEKLKDMVLEQLASLDITIGLDRRLDHPMFVSPDLARLVEHDKYLRTENIAHVSPYTCEMYMGAVRKRFKYDIPKFDQIPTPRAFCDDERLNRKGRRGRDRNRRDIKHNRRPDRVRKLRSSKQ